jgi:HlyD family secretion protein
MTTALTLNDGARGLATPGATPAAPRRIEIPPTPMPRVRGLVLSGLAFAGVFVFGAGAWSVLAPLESAAMAPGVVESESNRKTIQHLEGGIIGSILVKDGDHVVAGQPLIRLDDTKPRTQLGALEGQLWDARAREARLIAERDGLPQVTYPATLLAQRDDATVRAVLSGQDKIFETRRQLLDSKVSQLRQRIGQVKEEIVGYQAQETAAKKRIGLINEEISGLKQLVDKGLERKPRLLALQRDLAEIEGRRGDLVAQVARAQQTIAESEVSILKEQNDAQNEVATQLRDTQQKIHELTEQMQAAKDVLARIEVKAPEAGTVTDLKVHTPGGVINAGEPLMDLVPESDQLVVTVQVRPEDIDVVHPGLPAQVRLLPYKLRRVPPLDGTVTYVSADRMVDKKTERPYYVAKIKVDEEMLAKMPEVEMVPGMSAETMIKTGERTVAAYALSPILDSFHRAFREK